MMSHSTSDSDSEERETTNFQGIDMAACEECLVNILVRVNCLVEEVPSHK